MQRTEERHQRITVPLLLGKTRTCVRMAGLKPASPWQDSNLCPHCGIRTCVHVTRLEPVSPWQDSNLRPRGKTPTFVLRAGFEPASQWQDSDLCPYDRIRTSVPLTKIVPLNRCKSKSSCVTTTNRNVWVRKRRRPGLNRDLNPGPPAPEAGIIPLDH